MGNESSQKRKSEVDSDNSVVKKKKKKKDKEEVVETVVETVAETEVSVKKKKPYFRDKGEKGEKKKDDKTVESNTKSKFSISLPVTDAATDIPVLKSSGKGPKIIIAQEKKIVETKKTEVKLSKRKRKH